jgi:hypothetical protein
MVKHSSENRATLLVAGAVLLVFIASVFWGEQTALILGSVLGVFAGFIKGFTWIRRRGEVKPVE